MTQLNTKYFGVLDYTKEEILHFADGLFGFEDTKQYLLIRFVNEDSSMLCLQSIDDERLAFVVINPFHFMPNYQPHLNKRDLKYLNAEDEKALMYYVVCTIADTLAQSTANLKCPIVVNPEHGNIAKQVILEDAQYNFKHFFSGLTDTKEA